MKSSANFNCNAYVWKSNILPAAVHSRSVAFAQMLHTEILSSCRKSGGSAQFRDVKCHTSHAACHVCFIDYIVAVSNLLS
jgi:hypothetical protein